MSSSPALTQFNFRFRTDGDLVDNTPTWAAAEDVNVSLAVETAFRLRFRCINNGTGAGAGPYILRVSKNSGAYTAVTTTSGATLGAQSNNSSSSADEAAIAVSRLTGGINTNGVYDETGSATKSLAISGSTEFEYGLILKTAGATGGDTFDFRVYNSTAVFAVYQTTPRITVVDTVDDLLANDVISTSSVTKPSQLRQEQAILANDVKSNSSVSVPALVQRRDLLANDVTSASSVSQPAVTVFAQTALLANDVVSGSNVTQPAAQQRHGLLANDVKSNSSVSQPAVKALHGLSANDVSSGSSVGQPAVHQSHGILANDVSSGSSVSQPNADEIVPEAGVDSLFANDVLSASSVTTPAVHQGQVLAAADVTSASSVTTPALGEIAGSVEQALFAENVISASFVSQPMVDRPEVELPELGGGGGKVYGRGYSRRRWEELLRELEEERQAALQRAQAFRGTKAKAKANKAAVAASQAIARAIEEQEVEERAAAVAHAREITRLLEGAAQAKDLAGYLAEMKAAREAAIEMLEADDEDEAIMLLVA